MPNFFYLTSKLHTLFGVMIIVLLGLLFTAYSDFSKLSIAKDRDIQSYESLRKIDRVQTSLINMQSGARGYFLTGQDQFLEPYYKGQKDFSRYMNNPHPLSSDQGALQQAQLQKLLAQKQEWQTRTEAYIALRRVGNNNKLAIETLMREFQGGKNKRLFDNIRTTLEEITATEEEQLKQRSARVAQLQNITNMLLRIGGTFTAALTIILFFQFGRNMQTLAATNNRLEKETAERKQAELSMRESKSRVRAILENVAEGIVTMNEQGLIESYNPEAAKIFGYTAGEALGQSITLLMPTDMHAAHYSGFKRYLETGVAHMIGKSAVEVLGQRKDGSIFPLQLKLSEMHTEDQRLFVGIMSDITERQRIQEDLRLNEERYRFLYENNPLIYSTVNTDGQIISINQYGASYLGYTVDELIGKHELTLIHKDHHAFATQRFRACMSDESTPSRWELHKIRKDGSSFWAKETIRITRNAKGQQMALIVCEDITELKEVERMKNEFISTVSHELRTPMTSILGSLGLIKGGIAGAIPAQAQTLIGIAHSNSERLVRLINDILDVEKIESGKMTFDTLPLKLMPLLEQALEANQAYGDLYNVKFMLQEGLPAVMVKSDHDRLMQVMANLLSNAVKFSPPGDTVVVAMTRQNNAIRVSISDHGAGIPEHFRDSIFQKFAQADSSDTKQTQGTGLGLSITRAIVEKLGGSIGFETETDAGTTFYFDLPEWHAQMLPTPAISSKTERPRVLICEDDVDVANLLSMMLTQDGYTIDIAYNAAQTKQLLAQHSYAAMTLDIMLDDQDGISLIRELRKQPDGAILPIVVVSARAEIGRQELNGDAVGIVDWLDKPIDQARLLRSIKQATQHHPDSKPRILYVEDDADLVQVIALLLQDYAVVISAATLQEAQKILKQESFNLVILDLSLPDGNGLDLLPLLTNQSPPVPVVVFSGQEVDVITAGKLDAVLVKSNITNEKLIDTIQSLISMDKASLKTEST
ncbi:MAG: PAS domain S-box protein [Gammaproteobacteria bacterium]